VNDPTNEIYIATARAITPLRGHNREEQEVYEEAALPSQRSADLMAPKSTGFWSLLPYLALFSALGFTSWIGWKRLRARQARLVEDYGPVMVYYGTTPDSQRQITSEYKRKLGPGVLRPALFESFLKSLVTEKPVGPQAIQDASIAKRLLRIGDVKAVKVFNQLGESLKASPSLLGKLLFVAERLFPIQHMASLRLSGLFPYGASTVVELQRNMAERCFKEIVEREIDENEATGPPLEIAAVLRMGEEEANEIYSSVVEERERKIGAENAAFTAIAEAEVESTSNKPVVSDELDYPARSGEPVKVAVHAYQCTVCGYTMFPAAGREFKFYGADFVCPSCGAPKDKFVDVNES